MPRGDGTGPVGLGLGGGQARFGEPVPCAAALERRAAQLECQASEYRAMAEKAKKVGKKEK